MASKPEITTTSALGHSISGVTFEDSNMQSMVQVGWSRVVTVAAHAAMGALLLWRARQTDLSQSSDVYACYMFVWKLFYAEYLVIPFLR